MEPVHTHRSRVVVDAARLHRARARRERGQTLIEGPALIADAMAAGTTISTVFSLSRDAPEGALLVDERAMARLSGTKSPRGPVAVVDIPPPGDPGDMDVVVSVGVSDPGNVGTMIRTAAAFGMAFAYMPGSADPWSPKTLRAGAGGQFQTPVVAIEDPSELGCTLIAAVVSDGVPPTEVKADRVAILVGEEAPGLPADLVERAVFKVTIPTPGATESLNAAVAAGIIAYALAGRRDEGRV